MSNSPAWEDINPPDRRTFIEQKAQLRDTAARVRNLAEFAVQFASEGQLDRARNYLSQAAEIIEESK